MKRLTASLSLIVAVLFAPAAQGQVYQAPDGNNLPQGRRVSPHAMEDLNQLMAEPQSPGDQLQQKGDQKQKSAVMSEAQHDRFARRVDLSGIRKLAVFDTGRAKIVDTLAREQIERIDGKQSWKDVQTGRAYDPVFTYLDLVFNRRYYLHKSIIYVQVLPLRRALTAYLPQKAQNKWLRRGRLAPAMFSNPRVKRVLRGMNGDLRKIKGQRQVLQALSSFTKTGSRLAMVSPLPGREKWAHLSVLADTRVASAAGHLAPVDHAVVANPQAARRVVKAFRRLAAAWRVGDARTVNNALRVITDTLPRLNRATYPSYWRREIEYVYNFTHKFTIGYIAYLLGAITLLIAFAVGRGWVIKTGVGLLLFGFATHAAGITVRGLLAGRWPIHNQFESFIAISWFAVLVGIILMFAKRQWLFGAAASGVGAAALLTANLTPIPSQQIGPEPAILAMSDILYVHVNMVLCSYALIALGFFLSLFYLGVYYLGGGSGGSGGGGEASGGGPSSTGGGVSLANRFAAAGLGEVEMKTGEGAAAMRGRASLLKDLDEAQLIVLQLAFWALGVGIMLGAYWADHSWGRWWGWDPKETWALITWIIYLIAIHTRVGVKKRGLTTAWLSVVGFFVMLWCYWGVNMFLAGLHSYA